MLVELTIRDFAIIHELTLTFDDGFTIITGETGAGKSILIDAMNIVLGGQSDRDFVRAGAEKATVEAIFTIPSVLRTAVQAVLDNEAIEYDTLEEITLSREVRASTGRSTSRINGSVTKLAVYGQVGELLLDIHGQSENLSLLRPRQHIYLLDSFADLTETREAFKSLVRRLKKVRSEIDELEQDEAAIARRVDILEYQIQEIEAAHLEPGEEEALQEESRVLANSERLVTDTQHILNLLSGTEIDQLAAIEQLAEAATTLNKLVNIDASLQELAAQLEEVSIQANELAEQIRDYAETIDLSTSRLNEVEERLAVINNLKRKYGGSIEGVLEFADNARKELAGITHSEARLEELREQEEDLLHQIGDLGGTLSYNRRAAAQRLSDLIEEQLKSLRMENARFGVSIEQSDDPQGAYFEERRVSFNYTGIDSVNFMLSTNFGEPLKPLAKVASGGETSRSMLALKSVLSKADQTPTLIFDEVDQGIGGRLGMVIGEKLWRLSLNHQVLVVTHLAQLASFADQHYRVEKAVSGERTITRVNKLDTESSLQELTEMLGSQADSARQNAHDLVALAQRVKNGEPLEEVSSS